MGLDMYLYAEKHVSQYDYDFTDGRNERTLNPEYARASELVKGLPTAEYGGITISKNVAYWRKANAVHGWIVRECADGRDECQRIDLERDDLVRLRDVCVEALKDRDKAVVTDTTRPTLKVDTEDKTKFIEAMLEEIIKQADKDKVTNQVTDNNPIPPVAGFFFGGSEKDKYYYDYLAETADTINSLLASDPNNEYSYYYQASW